MSTTQRHSKLIADLACERAALAKAEMVRIRRSPAADQASVLSDKLDVVPITSDSEHYPPDGKLRVYRSRTGGDEWEPLTTGLPQENCYVNVLRDAMAVDGLDPCGIYFGTTGGQVYGSANQGDSWAPILRDLPRVLSVEVQSLP